MALNALITDAQDLTWTNINLWLSLSSWMHIGRWDTLGIVLHGIQIAASHAYAFILRNNMCMSIYIYTSYHVISYHFVSYHIISSYTYLYCIIYDIKLHIIWYYVMLCYITLHCTITYENKLYIYKEKKHHVMNVMLYCAMLYYIA